jgi:Bacteriophage related domain of unknown function
VQQYVPIQTALDTQLLAVSGIATWNPSNLNGSTGNFFAENVTLDQDYFQNPSNLVLVRSTLIPLSPMNETIGIGGYDKISGIYAVDVMGQLDKGYTATKQLADLVVAAFRRGTQFTLSNGEVITVETTGMAPNVSQGAWAMNRLYCVQVQVKFFGYMQP